MTSLIIVLICAAVVFTTAIIEWVFGNSTVYKVVSGVCCGVVGTCVVGCIVKIWGG